MTDGNHRLGTLRDGDVADIQGEGEGIEFDLAQREGLFQVGLDPGLRLGPDQGGDEIESRQDVRNGQQGQDKATPRPFSGPPADAWSFVGSIIRRHSSSPALSRPHVMDQFLRMQRPYGNRRATRTYS